MKSITFYKKNFRELKGSIQNIVISNIQNMYFDIPFNCIEAALWDSKLNVWICPEMKTVIKFDPINFERFMNTLNTYMEVNNQKQ
jgi:hypothetical protein